LFKNCYLEFLNYVFQFKSIHVNDSNRNVFLREHIYYSNDLILCTKVFDKPENYSSFPNDEYCSDSIALLSEFDLNISSIKKFF
jgi:hypothetical protein